METKNPRLRKTDGQPYGSPNPNARVRVSRRAELKLHNGESLKEGEDALSNGADVKVKQEEQKFDPPAIIEDTQKLEVIEEKPVVERTVRIVVSLDQKGILDKDNQPVDPYNNVHKTIEVDMTGKVFDIAKIAGRVANDMFDYYTSLKSAKGIKRGAGMNVNLMIEDNSKSSEHTLKIKSISKMRMSHPANIAHSLSSAILTQVEEDNSEGLVTGNFNIGADGQLLMKKLKLSDALKNAPMHIVKQKIDEHRIQTNNKIKAIKEAV